MGLLEETANERQISKRKKEVFANDRVRSTLAGCCKNAHKKIKREKTRDANQQMHAEDETKEEWCFFSWTRDL